MLFQRGAFLGDRSADYFVETVLNVLEILVYKLEVYLDLRFVLPPQPVFLLEGNALIRNLHFREGVRYFHRVVDGSARVRVKFAEKFVVEIDELIVKGDDVDFGGLKGYLADELLQFVVLVEILHKAAIVILVDLDDGEQDLGLLLAVVLLEPQLALDLLQPKHDLAHFLPEMELHL